jgi:hypothetical protein
MHQHIQATIAYTCATKRTNIIPYFFIEDERFRTEQIPLKRPNKISTNILHQMQATSIKRIGTTFQTSTNGHKAHKFKTSQQMHLKKFQCHRSANPTIEIV